MENRRKGQFRDDEEPVAEDYSDLEIDESADGDEFISITENDEKKLSFKA